jgi:protein-tyrosine-phosphatase
MNAAPLTVLFLSAGNAARSIMAEALLRHIGGGPGGRFRARSAGYQPAPNVHPSTLALLKAEGIPTDFLHTKGWGEFVASAHIVKFDVIVTLAEEARQNCPAWPGNPVRVHWPVDDPLAATNPDVMEWKFRKAFATLESRIATFVKSRAAQNPFELLLQLKDIGMVVA